MKKSIRNSIIVVVIAVILIIGYYFFPIKVNQELSGIKYRLGDGSYSEEVKVSVDGYLSNGLLHKTYFQGTVKIGDKLLNKVILNLDKGSDGLLFLDESIGDFTNYGMIYASNNMKELTIMIYDDPSDNGLITWSSRNGLMLSAPSKTREDALEISKKLITKSAPDINLK